MNAEMESQYRAMIAERDEAEKIVSQLRQLFPEYSSIHKLILKGRINGILTDGEFSLVKRFYNGFDGY